MTLIVRSDFLSFLTSQDLFGLSSGGSESQVSYLFLPKVHK